MTPSSLPSLFAFKTWCDEELLAKLATLEPEHGELLHGCLRTFNHIHVVDRIFRAHLGSQPRPFDATNTRHTPKLAELKASMADTDAWYEQHVGSLAPAQLAEVIQFQFTDGDPGRMTREEILLHVITHGGYHRGNIGQMLKAIGMTPPRELYTRFVHQREPARRDG